MTRHLSLARLLWPIRLALAAIAIASVAAVAVAQTPAQNRAMLQGLIDADENPEDPGNRGFVEFPPGEYIIDAPLKTYPWVKIRGDGEQSTYIYSNGPFYVFELDANPLPDPPEIYHRDSKIAEMSILALGQGGAIKVGTATQPQIVLENLRVSCGTIGPAIDLTTNGAYSQHVTIRRVNAATGFAGSLGHSMIKVDGNRVLIEDCDAQGGVRADFVDGSPILHLAGDVTLRHVTIEPTFVDGTHGQCVRMSPAAGQGGGYLKWNDMWLEPHFAGDGHITGGISVEIAEGITFTADRVFFLNDDSPEPGPGAVMGKLAAGAGAELHIESMSIFGSLQRVFTIDDTAILQIGSLRTTGAAGWLERPNVHVDRYIHHPIGGTARLIRNTRGALAGAGAGARNLVRSGLQFEPPTATGGARVAPNVARGPTSIQFEVTAAGAGGATVSFRLRPDAGFTRLMWRASAPPGVSYVVTDDKGNELGPRDLATLTMDATPDGASWLVFTFSDLAVGSYSVTDVTAWEEQ